MAIVNMDQLFGKGPSVTESTVALGFGKANFPNTSCTVAMLEVEAPFVRTLATKKLQAVGRLSAHPVGRLENDGAFYAGQYKVKDGTVLFVQAGHTRSGHRVADGVVMLRVRATGPFIQVVATLPKHANNALGDRVSVFEGRADILSLNQLADLGIEPTSGFINGYLDEEEIGECFSVVALQPQLAPAPTFEVVLNSEGEAVAITATRAPRRMRIRKADK